MDSSESDDYEDVISDDDEETVVKSVWTASKETRIKAVSRNASLLEVCFLQTDEQYLSCTLVVSCATLKS